MEDRRYPVLMTGGGKTIFFSLCKTFRTVLQTSQPPI